MLAARLSAQGLSGAPAVDVVDATRRLLAVQAQGGELTTIEGVATDGTLHPMQEAFKQHHGLQCGYCTPGMVLTAIELASENANPTEAEIRAALDGNFCRCTGYHNIVKAVQQGLAEMA